MIGDNVLADERREQQQKADRSTEPDKDNSGPYFRASRESRLGTKFVRRSLKTATFKEA
jgi:hypothetical protein